MWCTSPQCVINSPPHLTDEGEEVIEMLGSEARGSCRENGMDVLHLDRVLVDLHLPDGRQFVQGETDSQELDDGAELVAVLRMVEIPWEGRETRDA